MILFIYFPSSSPPKPLFFLLISFAFPASRKTLPGRYGPDATYVAGGGGRREADQHGPPVHCRLARCQWSRRTSFENHQEFSVS